MTLLLPEDHSRIIEMAWEDRIPFEAIEHCYGLPEAGVIRLMQRLLKPASFRLWRRRNREKAPTHLQQRRPGVSHGAAPGQCTPPLDLPGRAGGRYFSPICFFFLYTH